MKILSTLVLSFALFGAAHAGESDHYLLTPATLQKIQNIKLDLSKANIKDDDFSDDDDNMTEEKYAKALESNPKVKAILAKNGMTTKEFSLASYAMIAAGMHLMFEPSMDKKKGAALYASYPKERQANIELLRKNPQFMKK